MICDQRHYELHFMYPWRLIAILEQADIPFQGLFYPERLRCPLEKRIVRAIEDWPADFPTRKECRSSSWSLTIPEGKPLYQPHPKSRQKQEQWKKDIKGTIVEFRAYRADISWSRFWVVCRKISRLRLFLRNFKPLADFLILEESMWPRHGNASGWIGRIFSKAKPPKPPALNSPPTAMANNPISLLR